MERRRVSGQRNRTSWICRQIESKHHIICPFCNIVERSTLKGFSDTLQVRHGRLYDFSLQRSWVKDCWWRAFGRFRCSRGSLRKGSNRASPFLPKVQPTQTETGITTNYLRHKSALQSTAGTRWPATSTRLSYVHYQFQLSIRLIVEIRVLTNV